MNSCKYCPRKDGIIKPITGTDSWSHAICVDLIPEIFYKEDDLKEEICLVKGYTSIPITRYGQKCSICQCIKGVTIDVNKNFNQISAITLTVLLTFMRRVL